jgi:hypothetical protein
VNSAFTRRTACLSNASSGTSTGSRSPSPTERDLATQDIPRGHAGSRRPGRSPGDGRLDVPAGRLLERLREVSGTEAALPDGPGRRASAFQDPSKTLLSPYAILRIQGVRSSA